MGCVTVCLAAMVKNEEAVIGRMIESAAGVVDAVLLIDTGCTDATIEKAHAAHDLPMTVVEREWVDFGHGRTQLLEEAVSRPFDWVLMLDADQTVEAHPDLRSWLDEDPDPTVDAWMVEIAEAGTTWRLPRLTRNAPGWEYVGPTHEYLFRDGGYKTRPLLGLTITHHNDGSNHEGRMLSNIQALLPDALDGDPRSMFYVAESYRFLGVPEMAIDWYRKRAELTDGWEAERWYAQYQLAKLTEDVDGLAAAWRSRPTRAEPLRDLIAMLDVPDDLFVDTTAYA